MLSKKQPATPNRPGLNISMNNSDKKLNNSEKSNYLRQKSKMVTEQQMLQFNKAPTHESQSNEEPPLYTSSGNYSTEIEENIRDQRRLEGYIPSPVNNHAKFLMSLRNSQKFPVTNNRNDKNKSGLGPKSKLINKNFEIKHNLQPGEATERHSIPKIPTTDFRPYLQSIQRPARRSSPFPESPLLRKNIGNSGALTEVYRRSIDLLNRNFKKRNETERCSDTSISMKNAESSDNGKKSTENELKELIIGRIRSDSLTSCDESSGSQSESQVYEIYNPANILETFSDLGGQPKKANRLSRFALEAQENGSLNQEGQDIPSITCATTITHQQLEKRLRNSNSSNIIKTLPGVEQKGTLPDSASQKSASFGGYTIIRSLCYLSLFCLEGKALRRNGYVSAHCLSLFHYFETKRSIKSTLW